MAAFKVRRRLLGTGGGRLGSGANYADFDSTGYRTAAGTARILKEIFIRANDFRIPSAASGHATVGSPYAAVGGMDTNIPTIAGSSTSCDMLFGTTFIAPLDAATSGSVIPIVEMLVTSQISTASNAGVKLIYNYVNSSASLTTTGSVSGAVGLSASATVNTRVSASLPALASFGAGGQLVELTARVLTGACGAGVSFDFLGLRLKYLSDRDGTQST